MSPQCSVTTLVTIATMVREFAVACAALLTAWAAIQGIDTWKRERSGKRLYVMSLKLVRACFAAKDAVLEVRDPGLNRDFATRLGVEALGRESRDVDEEHDRRVSARILDAAKTNSRLLELLAEARIVFGTDSIKPLVGPIVDANAEIAATVLRYARDTRAATSEGQPADLNLELAPEEGAALRAKLEAAVKSVEVALGKYLK